MTNPSSAAADDPASPAVLFVPVSGPRGAGEFYRCQVIAQALVRRWPAAQVEFVVSREARYRDHSEFPLILLEHSPTRDAAAVDGLIRDHRPDVVIFDSAGRAAQLLKARRLGVRTVFISSRPRKRRRGFGWRRMRALDQHWIIQPAWLDGGLRWSERLKLRCCSTEAVQVDTLFAEPEPQRQQVLLTTLGLADAPFVLACAGGGGHPGDGRPAAELFADAAERTAERIGLGAVTVMGPNYAAPSSMGASQRIGSLAPADMIALTTAAAIVITGGGSLLLQAIACRRPNITVALAGDQRARIARCASRGLTLPARPDVVDISERAIGLWQDAVRLEAMRRALAGAGLENGLPRLLAALERLLVDRPNRSAQLAGRS